MGFYMLHYPKGIPLLHYINDITFFKKKFVEEAWILSILSDLVIDFWVYKLIELYQLFSGLGL